MTVDHTQTIADAEAFAAKHGQRIVIILAHDGATDLLVTYGGSTTDSDHAAMIGDLYRRFHGWDVETPAITARVQALGDLVEDAFGEGAELAGETHRGHEWTEQSKARVKLEAILGSSGRMDAVRRLTDSLTDGERSELFSNYCKACGSKDTRCQCWNDE